MPRPNSALSSNSEFDQAGPRPSLFTAVGRGGQVAAVDRGAAGGVGDQHAVAEQLRHQLDVRRFAAAGAGAGELEQRLQQLHVLHLAQREQACGRSREASGRSPSWRLPASRSGGCGTMLMALVLHLALALGRADLHAQPAAGAILRRHLQRVLAAPSCPSSARARL